MTFSSCACGSTCDLVLVGVRAIESGTKERVMRCPVCRDQAMRVERGKRRCIGFQCNERFAPNGSGRPALYHDETCRKRTDRAISSAIRSTVRNVVPTSVDDLEAVLARVEFLRCCWGGKRVEVETGRKYPQLPPPISSLAAAAGHYLTAVSAALANRREADRVSAAEASEKARLDGRNAVLLGRQAEDQAWRRVMLEQIDGQEVA